MTDKVSSAEALVQPLGDVEATIRRFEIIRFEDRDGEPCSLQQSSIAEFEPPGSTAVWLGVNGHHDRRMHLGQEKVQSLIAHLVAWLETGSFKLEAGKENE